MIFFHREDDFKMQVHDEREEKREESQELLVLILQYFSSLRALRDLRGATRFQPKAERSE